MHMHFRLRLWHAIVAGTAFAAVALAGDESCIGCHASEVRAFRVSGMGKSITPAPGLRNSVTVTGPGDVSYRIGVRDGTARQESIRRGAVLESHPMLYGIGSGEHGISYVVPRGDA